MFFIPSVLSLGYSLSTDVTIPAKTYILQMLVTHIVYETDRISPEDDIQRKHALLIPELLCVAIGSPELFCLTIALMTTYKPLIKPRIREFKPVFIGSIWSFLVVSYPHIPSSTLFVGNTLLCAGISNRADIGDVTEDMLERVYTIPVLYGEEVAKKFTNISIGLGTLIIFHETFAKILSS